jgi:hypothetical protein
MLAEVDEKVVHFRADRNALNIFHSHTPRQCLSFGSAQKPSTVTVCHKC